MSVHVRFVQELGSKPLIGDGLNPFSAYTQVPNIVLLGDPGSGKTHLFTEFAGLAGSESLVARSFLNIDVDSLTNRRILFIDALDERRAGRGDQGAVDEIVKKLFLVKPEKVRIACRAADWLGESDLAAFQAFFKRTGGCVVLSLQPLSVQDRVAVLEAQGVEDPVAFLAEALERGLEDLLGNPQNLSMLADVVQKRSWPTTRFQLFHDAVAVLLEEHSDPHRRRQTGRYSADELRQSAGELCAVRLISDIRAIGLTEHDRGEDLPSYRSLCSGDRDKALAALGRRVFVSGPSAETAEYAHRTIAEYLGASWIAERVRGGLPFGRVCALLGGNGRPASELRGLHAWLAVHLPEHAKALIDADPFGVLSYADARILAPHLRRHLLQAMAKLAEADPWFREGNLSSAAVAALSGPDMVEGFRSILATPDAGYSLRTLVMDSLSSGQVLPELVEDLRMVLIDQSAQYAERHTSVEVLLRMGSSGSAALANAYPCLGTEANDLRLRSELIRKLYGIQIGIDELVQLILDSLHTSTELRAGGLRCLSEVVAEADVCEVLDRLAASQDPPAHERSDASEALREFDQLLIRALAIDSNVEGSRLLSWLQFRNRNANGLTVRDATGSRAFLAANPIVVGRVVDAAIQSLVVEKEHWGLIHEVRELTLFALSDRLLLERVVLALGLAPTGSKRSFLYELAMALTFLIGSEARNIFEDLFDNADGDPELESVRSTCCITQIPEWRAKEAERSRERSRKRVAGRAKNRAEFHTQRESIRSGTHLGWLEWIAKIYFAQFSDLDREATPRDRLIGELGEREVESAVEGLIALARRGQATDAAEVIRMHGEHQHFEWWYAILAGLHEFVDAGGDIDEFSESYLRSVLTIECLHPTFLQRGKTTERQVPEWKVALLKSRSELVVDTYVALARVGLATAVQHVDGLYTLMHEPSLHPYRANTAIALLITYPGAHPHPLRDLIQVAMSEGDRDQFLETVRSAVAQSACATESRVLWLAAGFLVAPREFGPLGAELEREAIAQLVWALRDLSGYSRHKVGRQSALSSQQLEQILLLTFGQHPRTSHPESGWGGDRNAWDATEYALKMIALLSTDPSRETADVLGRLLLDPSAESYLPDIKHAIAQQQVRMIDAEFHQPNWTGVVAALANGEPAGIADLHALVMDHLADLGSHIAASNVDMFKRFWNEDSYGRLTNPKSEESCRDYLVELLRAKTRFQGVSVEPEGHMAADKRADIVVLLPAMKLVIELKRDSHADVWSAIQNQLDRFYTRDPDAHGFGIFGVFWFGKSRGRPRTSPPAPMQAPRSAKEMQWQLESLVPPDRRNKVTVTVLDVSGEPPDIRSVESLEPRAKSSASTIRFRDGAGNTWVGRGRRPKWLADALARGMRLEDFAVD